MRKWTRWLFGLVVFGFCSAIGYVALRETPILVDTAEVISGPMQVTINEEGITRVRDVYTVSSAITGHLNRITLNEGEAVIANETVIASIHPLEPPFLDERTIAQLKASVEAARAAVALAEVEQQRSLMALQLATSDYARKSKLAETNIVSESELEQSGNALQLRQAELQAAEATIRLRRAELTAAKAQLTQPGQADVQTGGDQCCIALTAPVDGIVLKVLARSEQAVTPGTRIAEIGDPRALEVVVDLISTDAVRIAPGAAVKITGWGGEKELDATVRRIDPAAFTKISSLGIEEQRVNAVLDLSSVPESLGHNYQVLANLIIWSNNNVVQIPIAALFRSQGNWATFLVDNDRAVLSELEIGQINDTHAQILSGIDPQDTVVLYPSDTLEDGGLIERRNAI